MKDHILVTGADKGLGLALVKRFLELGWFVFGGCYRDPDALNALKPVYAERLVIVPLDVTDDRSVNQAFGEVSRQAGSLDILLNNAGIHLENHRPPLEETDLEAVSRTLEVNAVGPLRMAKAFYPLLKKGKRKMIVNISSEAGSIGDCWRASEYGYCMSKAALNMQIRILNNALRAEGFRILAVHPGWMRTDMGGSQADIDPAEAAEGIARLVLDGGLAQTAEYLDYQGNPLKW